MATEQFHISDKNRQALTDLLWEICETRDEFYDFNRLLRNRIEAQYTQKIDGLKAELETALNRNRLLMEEFAMTGDHTENLRLRSENEWLRQSIERLQAQIARMQAERRTPTVGDGPGCDDEVMWSHSQVHNP